MILPWEMLTLILVSKSIWKYPKGLVIITLAFIINPGKIRLNIHDRQGKPFWLKVPNEPKNNRASKRATTVMLSKSEEFFFYSLIVKGSHNFYSSFRLCPLKDFWKFTAESKEQNAQCLIIHNFSPHSVDFGRVCGSAFVSYSWLQDLLKLIIRRSRSVSTKK